MYKALVFTPTRTHVHWRTIFATFLLFRMHLLASYLALLSLGKKRIHPCQETVGPLDQQHVRCVEGNPLIPSGLLQYRKGGNMVLWNCWLCVIARQNAGLWKQWHRRIKQVGLALKKLKPSWWEAVWRSNPKDRWQADSLHLREGRWERWREKTSGAVWPPASVLLGRPRHWGRGRRLLKGVARR